MGHLDPENSCYVQPQGHCCAVSKAAASRLQASQEAWLEALPHCYGSNSPLILRGPGLWSSCVGCSGTSGFMSRTGPFP